MRSLVSESTTTTHFPASDGLDVFALVQSPVLRPRLEGLEGALRGPSADARIADKATVVFALTLPAQGAFLNADVQFVDYMQMLGYLTVFRFRDDGVIDENVWPSPERNVSGFMQLSRGRIAVEVDLAGVCQVQLRVGVMLPYDGETYTVTPILACVQVHANVQTHDWEAERAGYPVTPRLLENP